MTQIQKKPEAKAKKPVDLGTYNKYISLKFLDLSGAKLKDQAKDELQKLEKSLLNCSGKKAKLTVNAAIGNEIVKLVKDIPIPKEIEKIINSCKNPGYYV